MLIAQLVRVEDTFHFGGAGGPARLVCSRVGAGVGGSKCNV